MTSTAGTAALRPSGVTWLGDVPAHWRVANIRKFAAMKTGHTPSRSVPGYWENCDIPWFTLGDVWQLRDGNQKYLGDTREKISTLGLANSAAELLPAGTVVLSRTASVGFAGIMPTAMATSQDYWNWVCGPELLPDYLYWVFRAMADEFRAMMHGSTHKTIYEDAAAAMQIPIPPAAEQQRIVAYLDKECARIDQLLELRAQHAKLVQERMDRSLDDALDTEGSPKVRLSRLAKVQTGGTGDGGRSVSDAVEVPYLRVANVQAGHLDLRNVKTVLIARADVARYRLRSGDVLMTEGGDLDKLGRGTVWNDEVPGAVHQNHVFAVRPDASRLLPAYLAHLTSSSAGRAYFESTGSRTTNLASTSASKVLAFPIPLRSLDEQRACVAQIDDARTVADALIQAMTASSDLLRERRQAVITAAVTGQFDVTSAVQVA